MKRSIAVALIGATLFAHAQTPRVALLLSENGQHHDEFDNALKTLVWSADRYRGTADDMRKLAENLGNYDMLIAAPLFSPQPPGDDGKAFLRFVEDGGLIAITDGCCLAGRVWLAGIAPRFGGLETGNCNSSQWAVNGVTVDASPAHPLRFFPERINEPNSWPHFHALPQGSQWQLVAKCSEGFPVTFAQTVGKGIVTISALRQPNAKQLGNLYACLQLSRAGIALKSFELPAPALGAGVLRLTFKETGAAEKCGFVYEVGQQRFEGDVTGATFELPYRITTRGPAVTRLLFTRGGQTIPLFERNVELPELLTVTPNAYRGILSTARRLPDVSFGIGLAPDQERLEGATVALAVIDSTGSRVAVTNATLPAADVPRAFRQPIPLAKTLPAGAYTVKATLTDTDKKQLADAETTFKILAPQPAQTIIDEDNTLLVNGTPFFPLGIYHAPPDSYRDIAALGLNTVQFWAWDIRTDEHGVSQGLTSAAAHGLKALYEFNHKSADICRDTARAHATHPALLMWYGLDEPSEGSYSLATAMRDALHANDDQHPVYSLSCRPDVFAEQAAFADVFALDPYGKPQMTLDWMTNAVTAVAHRKPVFCVPGSFGEEPADELRASAYIALTCDARGILWYPWSQAGGGPLGVGLKNSPELQIVIAQLCAEITALQPALTAPTRHTITSQDGKARGLVCQSDRQKTLLIVNTTSEKITAEMRLPATDATMTDFFKKSEATLPLKNGTARIELKPYETRVYCWQ